MGGRETAREHLRNALTLLNIRIGEATADTELLQDLVMVRNRLEAALGLIEEVAAEPRGATRAMKVWELL